MVTNCTYDGVCYNAKEARICWKKPPIVCTLTKPGTAITFQPDLCRSLCHARRTWRSHGPTVFATHSTHKLLNALSQLLIFMYVKVVGRLTSPASTSLHDACHHLPAVCHLRIQRRAVSMMDGNSGLSLTQEVIDERLISVRRWRGCIKSSPLTVAVLQTVEQRSRHRPTNRQNLYFADAPTKLLTTVQDCWVMHRAKAGTASKIFRITGVCSTR